MSRPTSLILAALLSVTLCACGGDEKPTAPPPGGGTDAAAGNTAGAPVRPPRGGGATASANNNVELPNLPELTEDRAKQAIAAQLGELTWGEEVRSGLVYSAHLGDRSVINRIHEELLKKEDDFYLQEISGAAMGLEALAIFGEKDVAERIVKLANEGLEFEDIDAFVVSALGRLRGTPQQADAEQILIKLADFQDPEVDEASLAILASWRSKAAIPLFLQFAEDEDMDPVLRGIGVAGLLAQGHERGAELAKTLTHRDSEVDPSAVMQGFRVEGVTETIPYMKQVVQAAIDADEDSFEAEDMCRALLEIYPDGNIGEHAAFVETLWTDLEDPFAAIVLWRSGRDDLAPVVADEISRAVMGIEMMDVTDAVALLEYVAERGVGRSPAFLKVVSAAAQITGTAKKPSRLPLAELNAAWLNVAGGYAFLRSR